MKLTRALLLTVVLCVPARAGPSTGVCAAPSEVPRQLRCVRGHLQQHMQEQNVPSISVAVARKGEFIWKESFGFADLSKRVPATTETMYSIASVTKPMTATAIMALVRDGKVDLDRPIDDYLGTAKLTARMGDAREATVRRVLNHTAGLPVHAHFFYADEAERPPPMDVTIQRYANLIRPPGERFDYSNLGYGLLDYVVSRVSGRSYTQFMQEAIFAPLGMNHSVVGDEHTSVATRYDVDGTPVPYYDFDHRGASAVFATAGDVARFGMFHLKNHRRDQQRILSDAAIDLMHRSVPGAETYGLGFALHDRNGYRVIEHSGGMVGAAAEMLLIPEADLVIVVLSNAATAVPFETGQAIASALLPRWKPTPRRKDVDPPPFRTGPELAGEWLGHIATWRGDVPVAMSFQADGDVHVRVANQLPTLVSHALLADGRFTGTFLSYIDTPDTARYDHVIDLDLTLRGDRLTGSAKAAAARSGRVQPRVRDALTSWIELRRVAPIQ